MCMKRQREETYQIFFCWRAQNRIKFQLHQTSLLCYPYNPSAPLSMRACLLDVCYAILRSYFCKTPKCKGGEGDVSMAGLNICSSGGYLSATLTTPALILVLFSHLFFVCACDTSSELNLFVSKKYLLDLTALILQRVRVN